MPTVLFEGHSWRMKLRENVWEKPLTKQLPRQPASAIIDVDVPVLRIIGLRMFDRAVCPPYARSWFCRSIIHNFLYASLLMPRCPVTVVQRYRSIIYNLLYASLLMPRCPVTVVQRYRSIIHNLLYASLLMPRCPVTVVQRYRDGVDMQPLVPLVFHNLPSLYPPSFRRNDFFILECGMVWERQVCCS